LREIALHLLDIAENSIAAGAKTIEITVGEEIQNDRLKLTIRDDGRGMAEPLAAQVTDPFVTNRTTRKVGLGLPLLKAAAESCQGYLAVTSVPGQGTCVAVEFQRSHIDRMPLGDLIGTILTLVVTTPEIYWVFHYYANGAEFTFDDESIKKELAGISLTDPPILTFIRELLQEGVERVQCAATQLS
jgi:anti-sigma regulatory factor (Ser/Thr protein kinase)